MWAVFRRKVFVSTIGNEPVAPVESGKTRGGGALGHDRTRTGRPSRVSHERAVDRYGIRWAQGATETLPIKLPAARCPAPPDSESDRRWRRESENGSARRTSHVATLVGSISVYGGTSQSRDEFTASAVIAAIGRLGPLWWRRMLPDANLQFRRVEIGDATEHRLGIGPLARCADADVKLIYPQGTAVEARTFCTCRDGEVVGIDYGEISAYSGRADGAATGKANIGLNVRFLDESSAMPIWHHFLSECRLARLMGLAPGRRPDCRHTGRTRMADYPLLWPHRLGARSPEHRSFSGGLPGRRRARDFCLCSID